MPIKPENRCKYPVNWKQISEDIRFNRANNKCEVCDAENYKPHPITGSKVILTVAHLDHNPENCDYSNLKAMCQKCHNSYDTEHRKQTIRDSKKVTTKDGLEVLYNFKEYSTPKTGIFSITTSEYKGYTGWVCKPEQHKIIGETDDSYVYKLIESGHGEWVGDKVIERKYILPIGIHKSRLIKWVATQLNLFGF